MIKSRLRSSSLIETVAAMALLAVTIGLMFQIMSFDQLSTRADLSLEALQAVDSLLLYQTELEESTVEYSRFVIHFERSGGLDEINQLTVSAQLKSGHQLFDKTIITE